MSIAPQRVCLSLSTIAHGPRDVDVPPSAGAMASFAGALVKVDLTVDDLQIWYPPEIEKSRPWHLAVLAPDLE